jgi:hypothetical protein
MRLFASFRVVPSPTHCDVFPWDQDCPNIPVTTFLSSERNLIMQDYSVCKKGITLNKTVYTEIAL